MENNNENLKNSNSENSSFFEQKVSSSNGNEGQPRIRFSEYKSFYKIKKIGDIYSERSERGNESLQLLSVTMNDGVKLRSELDGKDNSSEDKSNYKKVCVGDMVYNSMRMWQGANGISAFEGIVSPAYTVLKPEVNINNEYFVKLFKNTKLINNFRKNSQGLTSDTWNLKYQQIAPIKIKIPEINEQNKIADFLSLVDKRIEKQRQLVESLKKYKRGLLSAIFERKIKFSNQEWSTFKIKNLGSFYNGLSGKNKDDFGIGNDKFITYMNVYKNTIAEAEMCEKVFIKNNEKQNKVEYGDILFTQSSETLEEVGFSSVWLGENTPYLNSFCFGFKLFNKNNFSPLFLSYYLRSYNIRKLIMREGQGVTRVNLSAERLKDITIKIPSIVEQNKIANFIFGYDKEINIEEMILKKLELTKKSLLQQMFI